MFNYSSSLLKFFFTYICVRVYAEASQLKLVKNEFIYLLVGWQEGHPACKKTEWWDVGVVV